MSLSKQLILLISLLVAILFIGSVMISVHHARVHLSNQLESHAQDTATSLGLLASNPMTENDKALVQSMVDALFDRGDFLLIRIRDRVGDNWIQRRTEVHVPNVPDWFIALVPLETPQGDADVMSGWKRMGSIQVRSHPGHAYEQIWSSSKGYLIWFLLCSLAVLAAVLLILRYILSPLHRIEAQATAIANREFPSIPTNIFTSEFKRIAKGMNFLSEKIRLMLDNAENLTHRLYDQVNRDETTGLATKKHFLEILDHRLAEHETLSNGALFLYQLNNFKQFNQMAGYRAGDRLLQRVAEIVLETFSSLPGATCARISGAEYGILLENTNEQQAGELAEKMTSAAALLHREMNLPWVDVGHLGAAFFNEGTNDQLLAEADMALRQAQRDGPNHWHINRVTPNNDNTPAFGAGEWRELVESSMDSGDLLLASQPVYSCKDNSLIQLELFLRLKKDGRTIEAGAFVPILESSGYAPILDRWVIREACRRITKTRHFLTVNISPKTLADADLPGSLAAYLEHLGHVEKLIIEVADYGATAHLSHFRRWIDALSPLGVKFSIDGFGRGFSSFAHLYSLNIDFIKVDGSFIKNLDQSNEHQFYLQTLGGILRDLDTMLIAESVESEPVWSKVRSLGLDGGRGHWLGSPTY
jgi:diguanylate cyclase (GGDEF)-like protein